MATILIVDDMAMIRETLAETLRAQGYEVLCAEHGRQALGLVKTHAPDLVLLDVRMPVMDGLAYLRAIKADAGIPDPPVVLLTDVADREAVIQAGRLGARDYLLKSQFSLETLLRRITHRLDAAPAADQDPADGETGRDTAKAVRAAPAQPDARATDALKSLSPIMDRPELQRRLAACGELKALSPTAADVLRLTEQPDTDIEDIADAIKRDPAIAVKILKLSNSAAFARGGHVDSIEQAGVRLGMAAVRQAVLNISVVDRFGAIALEELDSLQFWEHSSACGLIAAEIARALGRMAPDAAFTLGLLHDVGRLLLAELIPDEYSRVMSIGRDLPLPLEEVEARLLSLSHAEAVGSALHVWGFPRDLVEPIVHHHSPLAAIRSAVPQRAHDAATLALADRLAHAMLLGSSGNETIYPTEAFARELKLSGSIIQRIEQIIPAQSNELEIALLSTSAHHDWPRRSDHYRAALRTPFRPLFVSDSPEIDAYRILCDALRHERSATPNLAVIHVTESRDALPDHLKSAEAEAGVENLPLLVLHSTKDPGTIAEQTGNRLSAIVPTPIALSTFIKSVNRLLGGGATEAAA